MSEKLPSNSAETFSVNDYENEAFFPYIRKLPTALAKKHIDVIETKAMSDEEAIDYLKSILEHRHESLTTSVISDERLAQDLQLSPERLFQSLETGVFNSTENYLGTGMTARVKSLTLDTKNGPLDLAIKYVVTPTEKTITAEQEHNVLKEAERMKVIEVMESKFENRTKFIRVPHPYLHHKSEKLQCYGMERIDGFTLEEALSEKVPNDFIISLQNTAFNQIPLPELAGYVQRFFETMHEQYLHGDMKAANMMIGRDGMLYVIDFGQSIAMGNVPSGAEDQIENLKDDEIKIAQLCVAALRKKLEISS